MFRTRRNLASEFARSCGFQRAKERAQSSRPNSSPEHHRLPANGASKGIGAPYSNTKALHLTDSPSNLGKDEVTPSEKPIENLNISVMEKHCSTGIIWDQDFPSMCSYVSDYDPSKSPGLFSEFVFETPRLDLETLSESRETDRNYCDQDSCCTNQPLVHSSLSKLTHQGNEKIHNVDLRQESNATYNCENGQTEKRRRGRNNLSISASIPSDVHGVIADSVAVVKVSSYPYDDFRESMIEMLRANNLSLLDVEELLYCYFCLNSPEHYDLIRESFFDACKSTSLL